MIPNPYSGSENGSEANLLAASSPTFKPLELGAMDDKIASGSSLDKQTQQEDDSAYVSSSQSSGSDSRDNSADVQSNDETEDSELDDEDEEDADDQSDSEDRDDYGSRASPTATTSIGATTRTTFSSSEDTGRRRTSKGGSVGSAYSAGSRPLRICDYPGCRKKPQSRGRCVSHGGGRRCDVANCSRKAQSRGLCIAHGGGKRCQAEGCMNSAKGGGFCKSHGGGKRCQISGCTKSAASRGLCITHGGGRRCEVDGCSKSAQSKGRCITHGGGRRCLVEGCRSKARSRNLCILHGGGKRCRVGGCGNSAQSGGHCIAHGGGKRCKVKDCINSAKSGGYCITHGGGSRCRVEGCAKVAHTRQLCSNHRYLDDSPDLEQHQAWIPASSPIGAATFAAAREMHALHATTSQRSLSEPYAHQQHPQSYQQQQVLYHPHPQVLPSTSQLYTYQVQTPAYPPAGQSHFSSGPRGETSLRRAWSHGQVSRIPTLPMNTATSSAVPQHFISGPLGAATLPSSSLACAPLPYSHAGAIGERVRGHLPGQNFMGGRKTDHWYANASAPGVGSIPPPSVFTGAIHTQGQLQPQHPQPHKLLSPLSSAYLHRPTSREPLVRPSAGAFAHRSSSNQLDRSEDREGTQTAETLSNALRSSSLSPEKGSSQRGNEEGRESPNGPVAVPMSIRNLLNG